MQNGGFRFILELFAIVLIFTTKWLIGLMIPINNNAKLLVSPPQLSAASPVGATVNVQKYSQLLNLTNIIWKYKTNGLSGSCKTLQHGLGHYKITTIFMLHYQLVQYIKKKNHLNFIVGV